MTTLNKKIIFSSGGTGGHIFPTLGIVEYFMKKGYQVKIVTDFRGSQYIKDNSQVKLFILNTDTPFNKIYFRKKLSYSNNRKTWPCLVRYTHGSSEKKN